MVSYLPLKVPEKVTIKWLINNLSIGSWVIGIRFIVGVFAAGAYFSETVIYQNIIANFEVVEPGRSEPFKK